MRALLLEGDELAAERLRAQSLPRLAVSSRERGDLIMLGIGGFTPLEGFMTRADWDGVCGGYRTASGLFWPIPITLSAHRSAAEPIKARDDIALIDPDPSTARHHEVDGKVRYRQAHECSKVSDGAS